MTKDGVESRGVVFLQQRQNDWIVHLLTRQDAPCKAHVVKVLPQSVRQRTISRTIIVLTLIIAFFTTRLPSADAR